MNPSISVAVSGLLTDISKVNPRFEQYKSLAQGIESPIDRRLAKMEGLISAYMDLVGGAAINRYSSETEKKALCTQIQKTQAALYLLVDSHPTLSTDQKSSEKTKISIYCTNAIAILSTPLEEKSYEKITFERAQNMIVREQKSLSKTPNLKDCSPEEIEAIKKSVSQLQAQLRGHLQHMETKAISIAVPISKRIIDSVVGVAKNFIANSLGVIYDIEPRRAATKQPLVPEYSSSFARGVVPPSVNPPAIQKPTIATSAPESNSPSRKTLFESAYKGPAPENEKRSSLSNH